MSPSPIRRLPFGLTVKELFAWGYRAILVLGGFGLFYLNTLYPTRPEFVEVTKTVSTLASTQALMAPRIENIEKRQTQNFESNKVRDIAISGIQQDLSAIKATQVESAKNTERALDRIFNRLDTLGR